MKNKKKILGMEPKSRDSTLLMHAMNDGNVDETKRLLCIDGIQARFAQDYRLSLFCSPAYYGEIEIVKLLSLHGAEVNIVDINNVTACHSAAMKGFLSILQLLVGYGENFDTLDFRGRTPRDYAKNGGYRKVVHYLDALVRVRSVCCFLIGIRKKGDLQLFPKEIVRMLAQWVWRTRDDEVWLVEMYLTKKPTN